MESSFEFIEEPKDNPESSPFLHSLDTLTPDDIAPAKAKTGHSFSSVLSVWIRKGLILVCLMVLCGSVFYIVRSLVDAQITSDRYSNLADDFFGEDDSTSRLKKTKKSVTTPDYASSQIDTQEDYSDYGDVSDAHQTFERMKSKLYLKKQEFPDLYGWIHIDNTNIDYPLMQSDDNDYYLTKRYDGTTSPAGSIFVDFRCNASINSNFNTVIYGHHTTSSKSMFYDLDNYFNKDFFDNNPYIVISTLEGIYTYKVFAVYETNKFYHYIQTGFMSGAIFKDFAEEMRSNSVYYRDGIEFTEISRIITLSTCINDITGVGRIAVQALLVDVQN